MRGLAAILAVCVAVVLHQTTAVGQRGKNQGTPATAEFDLAWPDSAVASGGPYAGVVNGGFNASTNGSICFAAGTFASHGPGGDPTAPLSSDCGTNVGLGVHPFDGLEVAGEGARQATISWTADNGYVYRLQFGDAFVDPPNYAHVTCLEASAGGACMSVDVDTLSGAFFSQSGELRTTGPIGRLTVTVAKGSRGVKTVGLYVVPFRLTITP